MNVFDLWIIHFVNSFAHRSWVADVTLVEISRNVLLSGGALMVLFWWAWFEQGKHSAEKREVLALTLVTTTFAVLVARALALGLPYRERPFSSPQVQFQLPYTSTRDSLIHWSSFPSDHAVLYFCLAAGLWMASRRLGVLALAYSTIISFTRIYIGAHFPTDILAGALLGAGMAVVFNTKRLRKATCRALGSFDRHPEFLYALLFFWTFEIGEMFDSLRHIGIIGYRILQRYPEWPLEEIAASLFLAVTLAGVGWVVWRRRHAAA